MDDQLNGMEHNEVTALTALDLSAAFDTVDHDILIDVLRTQYGVCYVVLDWIDSYLQPRGCCVKVNLLNGTLIVVCLKEALWVLGSI